MAISKASDKHLKWKYLLRREEVKLLCKEGAPSGTTFFFFVFFLGDTKTYSPGGVQEKQRPQGFGKSLNQTRPLWEEVRRSLWPKVFPAEAQQRQPHIVEGDHGNRQVQACWGGVPQSQQVQGCQEEGQRSRHLLFPSEEAQQRHQALADPLEEVRLNPPHLKWWDVVLTILPEIRDCWGAALLSLGLLRRSSDQDQENPR